MEGMWSLPCLGGGAYNVLPVMANGVLGDVSHVVKEIGGGPHPRQKTAHPYSVVFSKDGRYVINSDLGGDYLSVFRFRDGLLARLQKLSVSSGSGPSDLLLSPDGSRLYVQYALRDDFACFQFSPAGELSYLFDQTRARHVQIP